MMMRSRTLRPVVLIFVLGFLGWLVSLATPAGPSLTPAWQRAGSDMDPNGKPNGGLNPSQPSANTDAGSQMDPNGG